MENYSGESFEMIIAVLGLILTVASTIIASFDILSELKKNRINNFILANRILANSYWRICEGALKCYQKTKANEFKSDGPMLYKDDWLYSGGQLYNLSVVTVKLSNDKICRPKLPYWFKKLLPYKRKTLEQNLALVCNSNLYDGKIYAPVKYEPNLLTVTEGSYFDFINSSLFISLGDAYDFLKESRNNRCRRKDIAPFDFNNRVSKTGVVTLTLLLNVEDDSEKLKNYFILHKRSNNVAESKNMIAAIPSGEYQPAFYKENNLEPDDLAYTVYREFGEELLGYTEFTELNSVETIHSIFSINKSNINNRIFYLGTALNPVNLYLALLTVIVIDMKKDENKKLFGFKEEDKRIKISEIKSRIKENDESDEIFFEELTKEKVEYYANMHLSAPELKQIMTIFEKYFDNIICEVTNVLNKSE